MKVLIVMPSATMHGGAEGALMQFLSAHRAAGLEVQVCFLQDGEMVDAARQYGVDVFTIEATRLRNPLNVFRTLLALRSHVRKTKPHVLLAWMTKAHVYAGLASLGTGVRSIYFQHGLPDGGFVDIACRLVPAAGAVACSKFVADEQRRVVSHRVISVRMACNFATEGRSVRNVKEAKRKLGLDPDCPLVGIVGRLQRWKGMHVYLQAMREVVKKHPNTRGVIVGGAHALESDYPGVLEKLQHDLRLGEKVSMVGKQSNIDEWMQAMDVCVHASEKEPLGLVVLEAMACGTPIIASVPGGPAEIILDGSDGLLVQGGNHRALAEAICALLEDPKRASKMATRATARAREFTPAAFATSLATALTVICGNGLVDVAEMPDMQLS